MTKPFRENSLLLYAEVDRGLLRWHRSLMDYLCLGSSMSLRSFLRAGKSLSVLDFLQVGSSLSLRSFMKLGSNIAILEVHRAGQIWLSNFVSQSYCGLYIDCGPWNRESGGNRRAGQRTLQTRFRVSARSSGSWLSNSA